MLRISRLLRCVCAIALLAPVSAFAQSKDPRLAFLLVNLIQADVVLAPGGGHDAHFVPGANQSLVPYLFNQQIVAQTATFPIGSPTGGFAFTFDTASGTFQRSTNSFGPSFADRALTNGRGKLTLGANFQRSKYTSFEGQKLNSGGINFYLAHEDLPGDFFFEGDLVQAALRLDLTSATSTIFATYGVTNSFDLAVAIPVVRVTMDASIDATVLRLATGQSSPIHAFPGGGSAKSFTESGEATGIGDVLVRAKYRFAATAGGGLAAGVDVRLPSGEAEELLGTGAASATFTLIGSASRGKLGPHFNVGYSTTGESDVTSLSNEFSYKIGTELAASPKVTLSVDLLGRSLIDAGRLQLASVERRFRTAAGVAGSTSFQEYVPRSGALNIINMAVGGKINVTSNLLLNANVLVALNKSGLTARITPVVGLDFTF